MKKFPSKIGWEIWVPVAVLFSILGVAMTVKGVWPGLIVLASVSMFITALIRNTDYTITSDRKLVIRSWFLVHEVIDIANINSIAKSSSPISSPAASYLGRLEIRYNYGNSIIISPVGKEQFIESLLAINKSIKASDALQR